MTVFEELKRRGLIAQMTNEEKIKELQQQLFALQSENENLNEKVNSDFVNGSSNTVDILKRIARLEKAVFNQSEE